MFLPLSHPPPTTPVERFARIIDGLCFAIAARGAGGVLTTPLLFLLWGRLRRMAVRATTAAARLAAGAPPPAARPRAVPRPARPQPPRLPRGFAWVVRVVPGTAVYGGQLQALLADPLWAPLAAVPSVRRMLNPLCQMLGVPRPPRAPRPAAVISNAAATDQDSGGTPADGDPRPADESQKLPVPLEAGAGARGGTSPVLERLNPSRNPVPQGEGALSARHRGHGPTRKTRFGAA